MKRFVLGLGCVIAMLPGVASAALSVGMGPDASFARGAIPAGEQFMDLVFSETGTPVNEGLFAYDLYLKRDNPVISLVHADKPDNWVFTSSGASFQQADVPGNNPPGAIVVNAIGDLLGANQDIQNGTKAARVFYTIDPNAPAGTYHIFLDPTDGTTLFVSGDTGEPIPVNVTGDIGTVTITPEPASLSLLGIAGLLALRRRRAA